MGYFLLYLGIIWLCVARARARGRSAWGWGLFAALLAPVALVATWLVVPKPGAGSRPAAPARPLADNNRVPTPAARRTVAAAPGITVSVAAADDSVIEVTGPGQVLVRAATPEPAALPRPAPDYRYEPAQLGQLLGEKLALSRQEISWLNKFYFYENAFLSIATGREATALLYVAALKAWERDFKQAGTTLAQEVKTLHEQAQQAYSWYSGEGAFSSAGSAAGADIYLALFKLCENAVREHYGHKRKIGTSYAPAQLAQLEEAYQTRLGRVAEALLPGLLPALPPPDEAAELALNAQNTTRWKAPFDTLAARLPADAAGFAAGVHELARLNARNPAIENIFFEASKLLARPDREEALRLYLHYLYHDLRSATINNKPLAKTIQKSLFAQPEQLERFTAVARQLALDHDLPAALAQVPAVYARPRKKIQLDMGEVAAVRQQHTGTVELLNEYLQDAPEPADATATIELELPRPAAFPVPAAPAAAAVPPDAAAPAAAWAAGLHLTAAQQALLARFASHNLTLPQAEVEALATAHGLLRNQLIDSLNEACYDRLDDVLVEEIGDDYTIYEGYFQQLTSSC